jgi:glycosyltransferase involved in cell wall biosynthesis
MPSNAVDPATAPLTLSILVPVFNEQQRVNRVLKEALAVAYPVPVEIVVVDDGSTDETPQVLATVDDPRVVMVRHQRNRGKGAAIRTAADRAGGTHLVILDADQEYDPADIPALLRPVLAERTSVVFGNRHFHAHTAYSYWYVMGNRLLTLTANILFNAYIGDLETGLKLMPVPLYRALDVRAAGFGMEAEVTGKLLRNGIRPYDVPISYHARSRVDGKKITWWDGVAALYILLRERIRPRRSGLPLPVARRRTTVPPKESLVTGASSEERPVPDARVEEETGDRTATHAGFTPGISAGFSAGFSAGAAGRNAPGD